MGQIAWPLYCDWSQSSYSFSDDESCERDTQSCNKHQTLKATLQMGEDWLTEMLASGTSELSWQANDLMSTLQTS